MSIVLLSCRDTRGKSIVLPSCRDTRRKSIVLQSCRDTPKVNHASRARRLRPQETQHAQGCGRDMHLMHCHINYVILFIRACAVIIGRFSIASFEISSVHLNQECLFKTFFTTSTIFQTPRQLENWKSKSGQQLRQTRYSARLPLHEVLPLVSGTP